MNINSAKSKVDELLLYLRQMEEDNPKMYDKSKKRLEEIASTCTEIVEVISRILQYEVLETDQEEFGQKTASDGIEAVCVEISEAKAKLQNLVGHTDSKSETISSSARKEAIGRYGRVLKQMAGFTSEYQVVNDCMSILWRWFDNRFLKSTNPDFRYNIRRIPDWIRDIIVVYAYHVVNDDVVTFIQDFEMWCAGASESTYAVPYLVYQFDRFKMSDKVTLCAAVLYDFLYDLGLCNLCDKSPEAVYLSEDTVYSLCGDLCPESLNHYRNYNEYPQILADCNIRKTQEVMP